MQRMIYFALIILFLGVSCSRELPELFDPEGMPQNSELTGDVYTADGTKLDLVVYDGKLQVLGPDGLLIVQNNEPALGWVHGTDMGDYIKLETVVITGGWIFWGIIVKSETDVLGYRNYIDLSEYSKLVFDIKADSIVSNNVVKVSIKDNSDPDDGSEDKKSVNGITAEWQTFKIDLSLISTLDKSKAYLLFEIVIETPSELTLYIDNIGFIK